MPIAMVGILGSMECPEQQMLASKYSGALLCQTFIIINVHLNTALGELKVPPEEKLA